MLNAIKNFFKSKSVGYYIVAGVALFSLIVAIIFLSTYRNPELVVQMGNRALGLVPDTIGIFLLAGFAIEVVVLVIPQYRFVQIGAVAMFGLAFYKDILIIPDFIVGKINNVEYNGGNFDFNMFIFVSLVIIIIASIVATFLGFYKEEAEAAEDMKIKKEGFIVKVSKIGVGAVIVLVAVLASSLISADLVKKNSAAQKVEPEPIEEVVVFDPINDDIKAIAEAYDYDKEPEKVVIQEQETWNFSDSTLSSMTADATTRSGHYLVYYFEGAYSEGWQGDYSPTYSYMCLWDDGLFGGKSGQDTFKGFWYNSSKEAPEDNPETEDVNEAKDCLNMVSQSTHFESIITKKESESGFYEASAYIFLNMGKVWNQDMPGNYRSTIINGYTYYPEVALAIDTTATGLEYKVGDAFDRSSWVANRILKNLNFSSVFKADEVTWTDESNMYDADKVFTAAGEYEVKAKWNGLEASVKVTVTE